MESLQSVLVFGMEFFIVAVGVAALAILIAWLVARGGMRPDLEIEKLDRKIHQRHRLLRSVLLDPKELKKERKKNKEEDKKPLTKPKVYVLDFKGDVKASAVDQLREEISALISAAQSGEEVLVRVESPGGVVHGYGLAAAQLLRLKKAGLKLTVSVDKVAASGGYMMACTADRIFAAPFAIVGSIGVVAQVPNVHRLLKKHDVDYKEYTAGEFKRTVSIMGELTEKGEEKFREQLEETHVLFKDFVHQNRPHLDVSKVATGEYWFGTKALELGLIDEILTSDEWIMDKAKGHQVLHLKYHKKQPLTEKLSGMMGRALQRGITQSLEELESRRWL